MLKLANNMVANMQCDNSFISLSQQKITIKADRSHVYCRTMKK